MDFKAQIVACSASSLTISDTVHNRALAAKAGYGSWQAASTAGTFEVIFPATIFKSSTNKDAATHAGFGFQPSFGSQTVYEGTVEFSTCDDLKKRLADNLVRFQQAIDQEFPPDQVMHGRLHAVLSAILRRGYYQATGFFNSIMPFYKLLAMAGLPPAEA